MDNENMDNENMDGEDIDLLEECFKQYVKAWHNEDTILQSMLKSGLNARISSNNIYIPEFLETDDPLTRLVKKMLLQKKPIISEYKQKYASDQPYMIDNPIYALKNNSANMSIERFQLWCTILECEWEFTLTNNGKNPLNSYHEPIYISSKDPILTCDYEENREFYQIPLKKEDDPLKQMIKVAILKIKCRKSDYRGKGDTNCLINNMISSLKHKSKMMNKYFCNWCEILGLDYHFVMNSDDDGCYAEVDVNYLLN